MLKQEKESRVATDPRVDSIYVIFFQGLRRLCKYSISMMVRGSVEILGDINYLNLHLQVLRSNASYHQGLRRLSG
jgi:hypothetical protein